MAIFSISDRPRCVNFKTGPFSVVAALMYYHRIPLQGKVQSAKDEVGVNYQVDVLYVFPELREKSSWEIRE